MSKRQQVHLRFDPSLNEELKERVDKEHSTKAHIIRRALKLYLKLMPELEKDPNNRELAIIDKEGNVVEKFVLI